MEFGELGCWFLEYFKSGVERDNPVIILGHFTHEKEVHPSLFVLRLRRPIIRHIRTHTYTNP